MTSRLRFCAQLAAALALAFSLSTSLTAQQPDPAWKSRLEEAESLWKKKDNRGAERVFLEAFQLASDVGSVSDVDFAGVAHRVGEFYLTRKKFPEARHYLTQAEQALVRGYGLEHISLATVLDDLAFLSAQGGQIAAAPPLGGRQRIGDTRTNRGAASYEGGMREQRPISTQQEMSIGPPGATSAPVSHPNARAVLALYTRALAIREKHLGPSHPDVAVNLRKIGEVLLLGGAAKPAAENLRRALSIQEAALPPAHPQLLLTVEAFARALRRLNRKDEARDYEKRAREIRAAARPG